jgi:hypothetical protein
MADSQPIMTQSDYANAIEDLVKRKQHLMTIMHSRINTEQQIIDMRNQAERLTAAADRLEADLGSAKALYIAADNDLQRLRADMVLHKNQTALKRVDKLAGELAELAPEALKALIAQLEAAQAAKNGGAQ